MTFLTKKVTTIVHVPSNWLLSNVVSSLNRHRERGKLDPHRRYVRGVRPMIETGAYGERMAGYLHLAEPPIYAALSSGRSELAVTRLHAPNGFTDPTSTIPFEKAFSIHLHFRANHGGRLWLSEKLVPTGKRPSGGVTILDLEQDPIAFFPNPIDVLQFDIPRMALEEFAYENHTAAVNTLTWPHCEMDVTLKHLGMAVLSAMQRSDPPPKIFLDSIGQTILAHATASMAEFKRHQLSCQATWPPGRHGVRRSF